MTVRVLQALIVNRLVSELQPKIYYGIYDRTPDLPSFVGINLWPGEYTRWSRPSAVLKLRNIISLMSDEIEASVLPLGRRWYCKLSKKSLT